MAEMIFGWAPNAVMCCDVQTNAGSGGLVAGTSWHVLATDGTGYDTIAHLLAAGKTPFGQGYNDSSGTAHLRDPGLFWQVLALSSDNGSGANSSGFYYVLNLTAAPGAAPQGVEIVAPGEKRTEPGTFSYIWIQKITAADRVWLAARY